MTRSPFFSRLRPRSTGREDFDAGFLRTLIADVGLPPHDMLASACDAVAKLVADDAGEGKGDVILAGGGVRNKTLYRRIAERLGSGWKLMLSPDLGVPLEGREAMAFAVLGALCADGVPISLPRVTGASNPGVAGVWAGR